MNQEIQNPEYASFDVHQHQADVSSKAIVAMERLSEVFRVMLWEKAKHVQLSPLQIQLLIFISYHKKNQNKVTYLAHEFNMSKATISDAMRILIKKGYVKKEPEAQDKRSHYFHLSRSGRKLTQELAFFARPLRTILDQWESKEVIQLYTLLLKLLRSAQSQDLIHTQRMCTSCAHYASKQNQPYCNLLEVPLTPQAIRIDCEDFSLPV